MSGAHKSTPTQVGITAVAAQSQNRAGEAQFSLKAAKGPPASFVQSRIDSRSDCCLSTHPQRPERATRASGRCSGKFDARGCRRCAHVASSSLRSFDDLIGTGKHRRRDCQPEELCRLQGDDQLEGGGLLHGQVRRLCALQNLVHYRGGAPEHVSKIHTISPNHKEKVDSEPQSRRNRCFGSTCSACLHLNQSLFTSMPRLCRRRSTQLPSGVDAVCP